MNHWYFVHTIFIKRSIIIIASSNERTPSSSAKICSSMILITQKTSVDAQFCPGYYIYFHFGPWAHLWRVSNLGLEPCPFILLILFYRVLESFFIYSFISYLSFVLVKCHVCVRFVSCCVFHIYSRQMLLYLFNCVS